jgi:diamine N-acetyltransferase
MITIVKATLQDIHLIQEIAQKTWPETYGTILSKSQFEYMMKMMYSDESLLQQFQKNHLFYLAYEQAKCLGFTSCEKNYLSKKGTRIHKIYILPEAQGKGVGKVLMEKVQEIAQENQSEVISLNVNKYNKAFAFYQKLGFEIVGQEDIEIGNGYLMEDYKMELKI